MGLYSRAAMISTDEPAQVPVDIQARTGTTDAPTGQPAGRYSSGMRLADAALTNLNEVRLGM